MLRQRALLQLAFAAVHAMHGASASEWGGLLGQEQLLMTAAVQGTCLSATGGLVHLM